MIKHTKMPYFVSAGALAMVLGLPALAQDSTEAEKETVKKEEPIQEIEEVLVTGSLIPRASNNLDSMSPVTVVSDEEMAERGYISIGDVMQNATQNSGYAEGKASNLLGAFTTGGQEVNLRGFGSGRTLVLVNGRRIADYPLPFGGEQNGADVGTIPMSALSRVEVLAAGSSAIYGSDAVGGVVNYITKRDMEQTIVSVTGGGFEQGFGESIRGSLVTGQSFDRGSFTFGVEGFSNEDILLNDADYFKNDNPWDTLTVAMLRYDGNTGSPIGYEPTNGACSNIGFEEAGNSCTTNLNESYSINPKSNQVSSFFDGRYQLNDDIELFTTIMASGNEYTSKGGVAFWQGAVVRDGGSEVSSIARAFSVDELGPVESIDKQSMYSAVVGAQGGLDLGFDTWNWDVSVSRGEFHTKNRYAALKEEGVWNWLTNGATNVVDYDGLDNAVIVDAGFYDSQLVSNLYRSVTADEADDLMGFNTTKANSSSDSITFTLNGALSDFGVLAAPMKFAVRSEIARQSTEITPDARSLDDTGNGWYLLGTVASKGTRDRKALSTELEIPVLDNLDVSVAGRFDHYSDDSAVTGRASGQAKFIYRPTDWVKVRGGYSQTFRAPDMFNIYGSSESNTFVPDFITPGCFDGENYYCGYSSVVQSFVPDTTLGEETGDEFTLGLIWTPTPDVFITLDWYKVELNDLVFSESANSVLFKEWQCENGLLDGSEILCADIASRITRNGAGQVSEVVVRPVNQDRLERTGVDLQAYYTYESEDYGMFSASVDHSRVLDSELLSFAGDEPVDLTHGELGYSTPSDVTRIGFNWFNPLTTGKSVAAGINVLRRGGVRNYLATQQMEPMYDVNFRAAYQFSHKAQVDFIVQNLLNTEPESNGSGIFPGFWTHLQAGTSLGRSYYVQFSYQLN